MKKLLLILLLVLAGEISAQQAATIVVKTTPDNEIAYWPTGKEHLFCIALGTKAQAGPLGEFVHQFAGLYLYILQGSCREKKNYPKIGKEN